MRFSLSCVIFASLASVWTCSGNTPTSQQVESPSAPGKSRAPSFAPQPGNFSNDTPLTISSQESGVTIYYTTNGDIPDTTKTKYTGPIALSGHGTTWVIRAVAKRSGAELSDAVSGSFIINYQMASSPTIVPNSGSFVSGAGIWNNTMSVSLQPWPTTTTLRYTTNGADPLVSGTIYNGGSIAVAADGTVIKAAASKSQMLDSTVTTVTVSLKTADVTFSPSGTNIQGSTALTMATATTGATIRYTTDGSTPTPTHGTIYSGAITPNGDIALKAIAYRNLFQDSQVTTKNYTATADTPVFSLSGTDYFSAQSLTLSVADSNLSIRYTLDGSDPSSAVGTLYTGPIAISTTTQVKAVSYGAAYSSASSIVDRAYSIWPADTTASFSVSYGNYLDRVQTSWSAQSGAVSYNLYRASNSVGPFSLLTNTTGLSYSDTTAAGGSRYYYKLATVVAGGEAKPTSVRTGYRNPGGAYEPNDNASLAYAMTSGFGITYSQHLESPYDVDYFTYHANPATFQITIGNLPQGNYFLQFGNGNSVNITSPYNGYNYVGNFSISSSSWYFLSFSSTSSVVTTSPYTLRINCCF